MNWIQTRLFKIRVHFQRHLSMKIALIGPLLLSGCMGIYEGGFECPPGKGLGCTSTSDVNEKVNQEYGTQKALPSDETKDEECVPCKGKPCAPTPPQDEEVWFAPWVFGDQVSDLGRWDER